MEQNDAVEPTQPTTEQPSAPAQEPNTAPEADANGTPDAPEGQDGRRNLDFNAGSDAEGGEDQGEPSESDFQVPDEYKDRGWAKKVNSMEDVYKQLDEAQSLIGRPPKAPNPETASEKDIERYLDSQRPEDKSTYNVPEIFEGESDRVRDMLYEAGLSTVQAQKLNGKYSKLIEETQAKAFSEEGLESSMKEVLGEGYKDKMASLQKSLGKSISPEQQKMLEQLPNQALAVTFGIVDKIMSDYGAQEGAMAGASGGAAEMSPEQRSERANEIRKEITELQKNPFAGDKVAKLNEELQNMYK